jgi:hypothetical protein
MDVNVSGPADTMPALVFVAAWLTDAETGSTNKKKTVTKALAIAGHVLTFRMRSSFATSHFLSVMHNAETIDYSSLFLPLLML